MAPADNVMGVPALFIPFIVGAIVWILMGILLAKDGGDIEGAFAAAMVFGVIAAFATIYLLAKA